MIHYVDRFDLTPKERDVWLRKCNAVQPRAMAGQTRRNTECGLTVADRTALLLAWHRHTDHQSDALGRSRGIG